MFERSVATSRDSDTFSRNTATSKKIGGRIDAIVLSEFSSSARNCADSIRSRPYAPRPP
jgi:hypothetical protein